MKKTGQGWAAESPLGGVEQPWPGGRGAGAGRVGGMDHRPNGDASRSRPWRGHSLIVSELHS